MSRQTGARINHFVLGAASMGAALGVVYVAGAFIGAVSYPPASVASLIIRAVPGDFATAMIERLGHVAQRGLSIGIHVAALALGGYLGIVVRTPDTPRGRARRALPVAGGLFIAAVRLALTAPGAASATAILVYAGSAYLFARPLSGAGFLAVVDSEANQAATPVGGMRQSRRRVLALGAATIGGLLLGAGAVWRFVRARAPVDVAIAPAGRPFVPPPGDSSFPKTPGLAPEITPNADFYTVDTNLVKPSVDHNSWRLRVGGLVASAYELGFRELQDDFEVVEMAHTLTCVSNEVGGDLISTAVWRGVRLKDVLNRAGLREGVVDIVFRSVEGYSDSIPLAKALEDTTLVVFGMNGVALPRAHGFPARIIIPGIYGMKNVKWVAAIEAVDHNYQGYWQVRGWSDVATVKTQSRIDVPVQRSAVSLLAKLAGVAWAGDRGILRVEVSEDGGETWREAVLKRELSPVAWRLWVADIEPGSRRRRVLVRATDRRGGVQSPRRTRPHPQGASGNDVVFEVEGSA